MSKTYTAKEVAVAVLEKCKDILQSSAIAKKEENCEEVAEKEVEEHEKKMHGKKKEEKEEMEKRCWDGYKPVKGKKPYTEGSCEKKSEEESVDKCGDMSKSSKLKEFLKKKKKTDLKKMFGRTGTSGSGAEMPSAPAPGTSIASQIGFGKSEDKMEKARVDEGKSPEEKAKARSERHFRQTRLTDPKNPKNKKYMKQNKIKSKDWQKDWTKQDDSKRGDKQYPRKGHPNQPKGVQTGLAHEKDGRSTLGFFQEGLRNKKSPDRNPFWDDERHKEAARHQIEQARKENSKINPKLPKSEEMDKCGDMSKEESQTTKAVGLKPLASDKVKAPSADQMPKQPKPATTLKNFMAKRKK